MHINLLFLVFAFFMFGLLENNVQNFGLNFDCNMNF